MDIQSAERPRQQFLVRSIIRRVISWVTWQPNSVGLTVWVLCPGSGEGTIRGEFQDAIGFGHRDTPLDLARRRVFMIVPQAGEEHYDRIIVDGFI